jgi:hypothetical protein
MQNFASGRHTARITAQTRPGLPASTTYFLSAHAYCCEFDDGAIILDLNNDAYLGIDAQHLSNLRIRVGNWPDSGRADQEIECRDTAASEGLISDLLAREILTTSPVSRPLTTATYPRTALTIVSSGMARRWIPITHVAQFLFAFLMVSMRLKLRGLSSVLGWLRLHQSSIPHRSHLIAPEDTINHLASFVKLRIWYYTAHRRCLFNSLVLSAYLTRGMIPCTVVIGVSTKPFLAHSWVQIGDAVLDDTAEHVQTFKTILSIGECAQ